MEYVINFMYDSDAKVWIATNDYIPLTLESDSLDVLMQRVKTAVPELLELNELPRAKLETVSFFHNIMTGDASV